MQAPYFAFGDLEEGEDGTIRGAFASEQAIGYERGPIASAEIGRHLAILGSCAAAARSGAERVYYLATKARYSKLSDARYQGTGREFQALSEVLKQDRRSLAAQAVVGGDDGPFAHLHCEYQALSAPVFARLFEDFRTEQRFIPDGSPYRHPIALTFQEPRGRVLTARSQPLPPVRCAGHFLDYPAWPIAIIAETITQVVTRLLHHIVGREVDYSVVRTDIAALKLVSAASELLFEVESLSASRALSHYAFSARVKREGEVVVSFETELQV
ncbi:hypothetical protein J8I29_17195 [Labrys sp. LIt4]|uniref:hypothetical protein n=1 Tax=Labrys sp. LIt4 TaxID=2821355 RepID=UPI001AE0538C|nr:hypothetical protein [Labrys sp. LIt4]MBP0581065.1 hypothetical protein [Labrys sp. LIt4]